MVAVADIGRWGAMLFERDEEMNGAAIDLAGDAVTLPWAAAVLSDALGRKLDFKEAPIAAVRAYSDDLATMFEWFEREGYDADIARLPKFYGVPTTTLKDWAKGL